MCFSILISNTDDHLRNHGFLHERAESWALSPAFDLNPNPAPGPKELSLNTREAADVVAQVNSAVGHWRTTAASHGLRQAEIEAMAPAFEHAEQDRAHAIAKSQVSPSS